jgi:hypothetical protein
MKQEEEDKEQEEEMYPFPVTGSTTPPKQYYTEEIINGEKTREFHKAITRCPRSSHV